MEILAGLLGTLLSTGLGAAMGGGKKEPPAPPPPRTRLSPLPSTQGGASRVAGIRDPGGAAPGMADGMVRLEALRRLQQGGM